MGMKGMYKKKPVKKKPAKKKKAMNKVKKPSKKRSSYGYQPWTMTQTTIKETLWIKDLSTKLTK